ncbi:MAG: VCBS repeat-containing protein [Planctomycetota bacterium]
MTAALLVSSSLGALLGLAGPGAAQDQFAEGGKRYLPFDEDPTSSVAAGDLDGDGDADLVLGSFRSMPTRIYINTGDGSFANETAARMPVNTEYTFAVALGDIDGDGDLDLVVASRHINHLYVNDGTGVFADVTNPQLPTPGEETNALAFADVDSDGDQDLVLANARYQGSPMASRLFVNDGAGTFSDVTAVQMPAVALDAYSVALGDVDGDGDPDIVLGCTTFGGERNRLYLNDGAGTFSDVSAARLPDLSYTTLDIALADVDGDGDQDILCANGTFADAQQDRLYLNDGAGTFADATLGRLPAIGGRTSALVVGDVDLDGDVDVVFGDLMPGRGTPNRLYLNDGSGTFAHIGAPQMPAVDGSTQSLAMVDVDGDGAVDLVAGNEWQQDGVLLNDGQGTFVNANGGAQLSTINDRSSDLVIGDLDGDGDDDLLVANFLEQTRLYLGDATGAFTDVTGVQAPTLTGYTVAASLADVDADGDLDVAFATLVGPNRLWLNDGSGTFTDVTATHMPADFNNAFEIAFGDVDGDGDADMAVANHQFQANQLYLNDGSGAFVDASGTHMPAVGSSSSCVAMGDVDGDGDLDLFFGNAGPAQQNALYVNDGAGGFVDVTGTHLPIDNDDTNAAALRDVDGDGDLDLLLANRGDAQRNRIYENDGAGVFADVSAARLPMTSQQSVRLVVADFDADGDDDLLFTGLRPAPHHLHLNDGGGTFTDVSASRLAALGNLEFNAVRPRDIDRDGDLDLVVASNISNRVLANLLRQIDAPTFAVTGGGYEIDVYARHAGGGPTFAVPVLSTQTATIPLPPLGTLGLDPAVMVALPNVAIPQPAGTASLSVAIPLDSGLVGAALHFQALVVQGGSGRLTNVLTDRVLR